MTEVWTSTSERAAVERVLSGLIEWPEPHASETLRTSARARLAEAMNSIERILAAGTVGPPSSPLTHAPTDPACPERTPDSRTSENVATITCVACLRRMVRGLVLANPEGDPYAPSFGEPLAPWHRWFAWRPVDTIDRGWTWLRPVWRRRCQSHDYLDGPVVRWWQHVRGQQPDLSATR